MEERRDSEARSVQESRPAEPDAETREETIARVADSDVAAGREPGGSTDPSTRRGINRSLWLTISLAGGSGFVVGALAALILSLAPGPFETDSAGAMIGYMVLLGLGVAIVASMVFALLTLAREDGRVERQVEEGTGRGAEGAGSPSSPDTDLKAR